MATTDASQAQEWKAHWPLAMTAAIGLSFTSVTGAASGLFIEPLSSEFGWSRAFTVSGMAISALLSVLLSPLIGGLVDRWGSRRLAIPGTIFLTLSIASFGLATGSKAQWIALWFLYALASLSINSTIWASAVARGFRAGRSLAIAVMLCGSALSLVLGPPLARWLIADFGWRHGYGLIAVTWGGLTLLAVIFFLRAPSNASASPDAPGQTVPPTILKGLTFGEAWHSPTLIRIGLSTIITMILGMGVLVHQVPILVEAGVSREYAAYLASLGGAAGLVGKLVTGWLMGRFHGGRIGALTLGISSFAFLFLMERVSSPLIIVLGMVVIGYASGTKMQLCTYLTARYAGMRNYGKIFGVMSSLLALGGGLGPLLAGAVYDSFGTYTPLLLAAWVGTLFSAFLIGGLGPYPEWEESAPMSDYADAPAAATVSPA